MKEVQRHDLLNVISNTLQDIIDEAVEVGNRDKVTGLVSTAERDKLQGEFAALRAIGNVVRDRLANEIED